MVSAALCIHTRIYRDGLIGALGGTTGIAPVWACSRLGELRSLLDRMSPDVILIDIQLERGLATAISEAHNAYRIAGGRPIVALGSDLSCDEIADLLEAGVDGYVTTSDSIDDLVRILCAAARRELCCTPQVARTLRERLTKLSVVSSRESRVGKLSRREREVLGMVNHGRSNKEIARELSLETSTVKNHVHNIISKLGVRNRYDAVTVLKDG